MPRRFLLLHGLYLGRWRVYWFGCPRVSSGGLCNEAYGELGIDNHAIKKHCSVQPALREPVNFGNAHKTSLLRAIFRNRAFSFDENYINSSSRSAPFLLLSFLLETDIFPQRWLSEARLAWCWHSRPSLIIVYFRNIWFFRHHTSMMSVAMELEKSPTLKPQLS